MLVYQRVSLLGAAVWDHQRGYDPGLTSDITPMHFAWDIRVLLTYQRVEKLGHTDQDKYLPGPTTQSTSPWCKRMSSWEP